MTRWPLLLVSLIGASSGLGAEPLSAPPAELDTQILLSRAPGQKASKDLSLVEGPLEPKIETTEGPPATKHLKVVLKGTFERKLWSLLHRSESLQVGPDGKFEFTIELTAAVTRVPLSAVGPRGNLETTNYEIRCPGWESYVKADLNPAPRRFSARLGLGPSLIFFSDGRFTPATLTALTLTGGANVVVLPPRWEAGVSAYFNVLPLTSSFTSTQIRFLGLNARAGYRAPWLPSPWELRLHAGWYFMTMMVSTNDRGFAAMNGPQLYPQLTYTLANRNAISGYLKYSPMFNGFSVMSLGNCEIAAGGSFGLLRPNGHRILFTMDYSSSWLTVSGIPFSTTSFSLGAGYEI